MNYKNIRRELLRTLRGNLSQTQINRKLGHSSNTEIQELTLNEPDGNCVGMFQAQVFEMDDIP